VSNPEAGTVHLDVDDGVATLELSSPSVRNAWDPGMDAAYLEALEAVEADRSVRVVVVRGAGGHFCPGRAMAGLQVAAHDDGGRRQSHGIDRTRAVTKPVIAVIHGSCAGVGLTLALLCDVRFAATTARFSTAFVRRGLVAGHGTSWLLERTVGLAQASELLLSGRRFDGAEAARIGLVHRALPAAELDAHVVDYARELATMCSPRSMGIIKRQLRDDLERRYDEALDASVALAAEAFAAPDFAEGVASYRERRQPRFPPPPAGPPLANRHGEVHGR
jgi:enoyl-CoA hydratase/carnithine racemase